MTTDELIAQIRDSQPREHTPLCYTPEVCQCGANVYNALRSHALALCEAVEKESQLEFCNECNHPLSDCGPQNSDGTPSMDCMVCQLKSDLLTERLAKETAEKERDAAQTLASVQNKNLLTIIAERDAALKERDRLHRKWESREPGTSGAIAIAAMDAIAETTNSRGSSTPPSQHVRALAAERDALLRDKERLDWMEKMRIDCEGHILTRCFMPGNNTLRDAIDAMSSQPPPASHVSVDGPQP